MTAPDHILLIKGYFYSTLCHRYHYSCLQWMHLKTTFSEIYFGINDILDFKKYITITVWLFL